MTARPVVKTVRCLVPGCGRTWHVEGHRQGFVMSGIKSHVAVHWQRYHEKEKHVDPHPGDWHAGCKKCHPKSRPHHLSETLL